MELDKYLQSKLQLPQSHGKIITEALVVPYKEWSKWKTKKATIFLFVYITITGLYGSFIINQRIKYPAIPFTIRFLLGHIFFNICLGFIIGIYRYNSEEFLRSVAKSYTENSFTRSDFREAAEVLKVFKKMSYTEAIEKYPKRLVDILVLTHTIDFVEDKKLQRVVSLKAIEEDREAIENDND